MDPSPGPLESNQTVHPCPGHQVVAACDIPPGMHTRTLVKAGATGEIVRTPAFFCTTYSLKFDVHGKEITVHGVHRHEFQVVESSSGSHTPGFPPVKRYPQPRRVQIDGDTRRS